MSICSQSPNQILSNKVISSPDWCIEQRKTCLIITRVQKNKCYSTLQQHSFYQRKDKQKFWDEFHIDKMQKSIDFQERMKNQKILNIFILFFVFLYFNFVVVSIRIQFYKSDSVSIIWMRSGIAKSFNYSQKELPLRKGIVEKKSKWMKLWRIRQITLFSNKLVFTTEENSKPKDSNLIYLGDINEMESNLKNPTMLKIDTIHGVFEVKFGSQCQKESWISDIGEARRTHQINKNQSPNFKKCSTEKICPNNIFCVTFECF